jgi:hypothetical protein
LCCSLCCKHHLPNGSLTRDRQQQGCKPQEQQQQESSQKAVHDHGDRSSP